MILPIESRVTKKSVKNEQNRLYFGQISEIFDISMKYREYISRSHVLKFLKKIDKISIDIRDISVTIGDISVKYRKYQRYIGYFDLNQIQ